MENADDTDGTLEPWSSGAEARAALTDPETRLPNRLHFDVVYEVAFTAATRGLPITILLLDVPALNGATGDEILALVRHLTAVTRRMDLLARVDRTVLGILLLDSNVHGGRLAVERILGSLDPWLRHHDTEVKVGIASFLEGMEEPPELVEQAWRALGRARDGEGDRVEIA